MRATHDEFGQPRVASAAAQFHLHQQHIAQGPASVSGPSEKHQIVRGVLGKP
jgi:hypothetical protein